MKRPLLECLRERGLLDATTSEKLEEELAHNPIRFYLGFDPTADSLHIGSLVGIVVMAWFQRYGHTPVVILGGATGRIGDPSGKSIERPFLDPETVRTNVGAIQENFGNILDFNHPTAAPIFLDNDSWFSKLPLIDFLRDIGKHFRVNQMIAKESVQTRLNSEEGISFTEFSYQMLQAYDFYHLFQHHQVVLQLGGSDQWGNITAGIELVRKLLGKSVYGMTFPLLTKSDGTKFGKSESGTVWLSEKKLSSYEFYQYFFRVEDRDVIRVMKMLTFMKIEEIREMEAAMQRSDYQPNTAQKRLAQELTGLVHGKEAVERAERATKAAAFGSENLNLESLKEALNEIPSMTISRQEVLGQKYAELLVRSGLVLSKGEANRLILNGGAYLNNERVEDPAFTIETGHLLGNQFLLFGAGKKKKLIMRVHS